MSYPKSRLTEALQVIREDDNRRNALEREKLLRTQYRDVFHLRRPKVAKYLDLIYVDGGDTSGDDYDPDSKKPKSRLKKDGCRQHGEEEGGNPRKSKKQKRKAIVVQTVESAQDSQANKQASVDEQQADFGLLDASEILPGHNFVSIRFSSAQGRNFLRKKLQEHPETDIKICHIQAKLNAAGQSLWRRLSGGLSRADRSASEERQDFEVANEMRKLDEDMRQVELNKPRRLRSGKVRTELATKKRKSDDSDMEAQVHEVKEKSRDNRPKEFKSKASKRPKYNEEISNNSQIQRPKHVRKLFTTAGKSIDDTISIDSSSANSPAGSRTPSTEPSPIFSSHKESSTSTPTTPSPTTSKTTSQIRTLQTHFSHPINFKSPIATTCTFHADYRFPIFGHGPKTGQYLWYRNTPSQLVEIESGHRAANTPADTMCVACALSYLSIIHCPGHTFQPLTYTARSRAALSNHGTAYVSDLYTSIKPGDPSRNTHALAETCRLCPAPASQRCSAPQTTDKLRNQCRLPGETVEAAQARITATTGRTDMQVHPPRCGCDLVLCSTCAAVIRGQCAGQMQGYRQLILRETRRQPLGCRADAEFLFEEGLVWLAWNVDRE